MKKKTKQIDWETIEREYRAGMLSIREVARRHSVDHSYLLRLAKKRGWTRDLTEKVKRAVTTKLVTTSVTTPNARDEEIIDAESNRVVQVATLHRVDIQLQRGIAADLLTELKSNAASLKERSEIFRNLTQAAARYIPLERQAWNLNERSDNNDTPGKSLDRVLEAIDGKTLNLVNDNAN